MSEPVEPKGFEPDGPPIEIDPAIYGFVAREADTTGWETRAVPPPADSEE